MRRQLSLDRSTGSLAVRIVRAEQDLTARLVRGGDDSVFADLPLTSQSDGIASFGMTEAAHLLPFGFYQLLIKAGECVCACLPVNIPKCAVTRHGSCDADAEVCLPSRECTAKPEEACPEPKGICDIWNPDCGNKISESTGIVIDPSAVCE